MSTKVPSSLSRLQQIQNHKLGHWIPHFKIKKSYPTTNYVTPPQQTKSSIQQITKGPKKLKFEKFEKFEMFFPKMNLVWDVLN